jgi:hypothetical protein
MRNGLMYKIGWHEFGLGSKIEDEVNLVQRLSYCYFRFVNINFNVNYWYKKAG